MGGKPARHHRHHQEEHRRQREDRWVRWAHLEEQRCGHLFDGIPIAALTVQRFRGSDSSILVTTDTYFSHQQSAKDTTKYRFDGEILGKGRLVLSVVKRHVETHPDITFPELEQAFRRPAKDRKVS